MMKRNLCDYCKECEDNDKSLPYCFNICSVPIDILHNYENERNDKAVECKAESEDRAQKAGEADASSD